MAQPSVPQPYPPVAPRRRSGCLTAFLIVLAVIAVCVCAAGGGAWYLWRNRDGGSGGGGGGEAKVGQCFPAATDGPLDTEHGTVSCSHPNAMWKITKVIDGRSNGDVIGTCGPDGDALVYLSDADKSYC